MDSVFSRDDQIVDANLGAQRKPPSLIAAPALVWQRGFWRPTDLSIDQWREALDDFLLKLFVELEGRRDAYNSGRVLLEKIYAKCPNLVEWTRTLNLFRSTVDLNDDGLTRKLNDEIMRHDTFSYAISLSGINIIFCGELHHEYWTLTISADYSNFVNSSTTEIHGLIQAGKLLNIVHRIVCKRHNLRRGLSAKAAGEVKASHDKILAHIQTLLISDFRTWCDELIDKATASDANFKIKNCGGLFADFMGLALLLGYKREGDEREKGLVRIPRLEPSIDRSVEDEIKGTEFTGDEALRLIDASWPVVKRFQVDDSHDELPFESEMEGIPPTADRDAWLLKKFGSPEYTVSRLQGSNVILTTSMGRQFRATTSHQSPSKTYCFFVSYRSKWRFGRLLDRVLALELTRLAAVRDLRSITEASGLLKLESDKIRDYQFRRETDRRIMPANRGDEAPRPNPTEVPIEIAKAIRETSKKVPDGLMYRIEKSRYYVARYRNLLSQLRVERVDGFAEYKGYSARRLFDAMDFINRVGQRYEYLSRSAGRLIAIEAADEAREIREEHKDAAKRTNHLLDNAEIIIIMPLAYYAGYVLSHLFETHTASCAYGSDRQAYIFGLLFAVVVGLLVRIPRITSFVPRWVRLPVVFGAIMLLAVAASYFQKACP